jgi:hypothetical protein
MPTGALQGVAALRMQVCRGRQSNLKAIAGEGELTAGDETGGTDD